MTQEEIMALRPGDRIGRKGGHRRKHDVWTIQEIHRVETVKGITVQSVNCPNLVHRGQLATFFNDALVREVEFVDHGVEGT